MIQRLILIEQPYKLLTICRMAIIFPRFEIELVVFHPVFEYLVGKGTRCYILNQFYCLQDEFIEIQ